MRTLRYVSGGVVVLGVAWAVFYFWPRKADSTPVDPAPFMASLEFVRHEDQEPLDPLIEVRPGSGFYADLSFVPGDAIPEQVSEGVEVLPPERWPMVLQFYPQYDPAKRDLTRMPFFLCDRGRHRKPARFRASRTIRAPPGTIPIASIGLWTSNVGFEGTPSQPKEWPKDEIRLWTFITTGSAEPGEYIYEVVIYPTAKWVSRVRFALGSPVVVRRGLLRVVPREVE